MNDGYLLKKLSNYTIGDFVKLTDFGGCYTVYKKAFKAFGIDGFNPTNLSQNTLSTHVHKDATWIVCNLAVHGNNSSCILYHIKNQYNEHLVVNRQSLKLYKDAIKRYPCPFLRQIPSSDF